MFGQVSPRGQALLPCLHPSGHLSALLTHERRGVSFAVFSSDLLSIVVPRHDAPHDSGHFGSISKHVNASALGARLAIGRCDSSRFDCTTSTPHELYQLSSWGMHARAAGPDDMRFLLAPIKFSGPWPKQRSTAPALISMDSPPPLTKITQYPPANETAANLFDERVTLHSQTLSDVAFGTAASYAVPFLRSHHPC
jgi:hypothetical protein